MTDLSHIRNFSIIAHIDHGKSTLADRLIEYCGGLSAREMKEQVLDSMDIERERGITIKAQTVRLRYKAKNGQEYQLNLMDTPGHVDFAYEVSRCLAACEGSLLVVDASQGVEAQTLANVYQAIDNKHEIVPVLNKIDLPAADPERVRAQIEEVIGIDASEAVLISAKTGLNIQDVLEAIVHRLPPPKGDINGTLKAMLIDSWYDPYLGVVTLVRVQDGQIKPGIKIRMMATGASYQVEKVGVFRPKSETVETLTPGEVGFLTAAIKAVADCRIGDTVTDDRKPASEPLPGFKASIPVVFCGLFPTDAADYAQLRDSLDKLHLNDASFQYEAETSAALGVGFRCGFLGLLHLEIIQERLEREYDLDIVVTAPSVEYQLEMKSGENIVIDSPAQLPNEDEIVEIREPWMVLQIFTPTDYYGTVMELVTKRRGVFKSQDYPAPKRVQLNFEIPLSELIVNFFDDLKSRTRGYASMDYSYADYRPGNLQKLEVLVGGEPVDALAAIVHKEDAYHKGQLLVTKLKDLIPRQLFDVPVQASAGGRIISRANVKAMRKDVLAKCYGGDITRKKKLLEKQKKGKRRMKMVGAVEIPQEAFMAVLRLEDE